MSARWQSGHNLARKVDFWPGGIIPWSSIGLRGYFLAGSGTFFFSGVHGMSAFTRAPGQARGGQGSDNEDEEMTTIKMALCGSKVVWASDLARELLDRTIVGWFESFRVVIRKSMAQTFVVPISVQAKVSLWAYHAVISSPCGREVAVPTRWL